jgi:hypothetical protein
MDDDAAEMMTQRHVYMVPTLSALATTAACPTGCGIPDSARSKARNMVKQHERSFRAALRRGVPIAMGTDAGTPFNYHGDNAQELERMVALGMTPMEAIMTSTSAAARLLGLIQDIGSIAAGKQADLLVVEGNPLRNIGVLLKRERIAGVMQRGRFVAGPLSRSVKRDTKDVGRYRLSYSNSKAVAKPLIRPLRNISSNRPRSARIPPSSPFANHRLRHHHLHRDLKQALFPLLHIGSHELIQDFRPARFHDGLLEGVIPLMRHRAFANEGQFRFDPWHHLHQDGEDFLPPFVKELFLHLLKDQGRIHRLGPRLFSPMQAIIGSPALGIAQDLIGGVDLADLLLCLLVVGIAVWMVLENELPVGFFDVVVGNVARHTEDTIIIQARHTGRDYTMPLRRLHLDSVGTPP